MSPKMQAVLVCDRPSARIWWGVAIGCFIVFAAMDLFPWRGTPYFRYPGSDSAYVVWNLGWPVALAIYDSRSGIHIGPLVYAVFPFQVSGLFLIGAAAFLFRKRRNPAVQAKAAPCC